MHERRRRSGPRLTEHGEERRKRQHAGWKQSLMSSLAREANARAGGDIGGRNRLLPPKKRAASDHSTDGVGSASLIPPNKKSWMEVPEVQIQHDSTSNSNAITVASTSSEQPQEIKLMQDAIPSGAPPAVEHLFMDAVRRRRLAPASNNGAPESTSRGNGMEEAGKKNANRNKNRKESKAAGQEDIHATPHAGMPARLREHLMSAHGATEPGFVYWKELHVSDVDRNQNRLLFSCKPEIIFTHRITEIFTAREMRYLLRNVPTVKRDENGEPVLDQQGKPKRNGDAGLTVSAFDGRGGQYRVKLRYLTSNGGYRFIGQQWRAFLDANNLHPDQENVLSRDVHIEVWAFRSRQLPELPPLQPADAKEQKYVELEDVYGDLEQLQDEAHPDGELGIAFVLYEGKRYVGEESNNCEEERRNICRRSSKKNKRTKRALPVHETEREASPEAVQEEEEKPADAHPADEGQAMAGGMTLVETASVLAAGDQDMANPLIGLLMLTCFDYK
ncbi:hypothetical protein BRADI_2g49412v3 [Brachypodium distachyon]|uniref:Uncharacterized protein n=1 Tax=Brachypodium distachyon TaxID=15368 RepID=A0A0Q3GED4_BRADI|nr:hypothetical protein BRADI_2g49412v3 [Brachypodium distachyon]